MLLGALSLPTATCGKSLNGDQIRLLQSHPLANSSTLLHSDSEMEMEAEHYPNGVLESMSTRIVNGAYKHEDLQTDESSMGKGHALTWCSTGGNAQARCPFPTGRDLGWAGFGSLRSSGQSWFTASLASHEWVFEVGRPWPAANTRAPAFEARGT